MSDGTSESASSAGSLHTRIAAAFRLLVGGDEEAEDHTTAAAAAGNASTEDPGQERATPLASPIQPGDLDLGAKTKATRKTLRSVVTSFGAIGLVILGTVPFSDLGKLQGADLGIGLAGLSLAGLGVVIAIGAASWVEGPLSMTSWTLLTAEKRRLNHNDRSPWPWPYESNQTPLSRWGRSDVKKSYRWLLATRELRDALSHFRFEAEANNAFIANEAPWARLEKSLDDAEETLRGQAWEGGANYPLTLANEMLSGTREAYVGAVHEAEQADIEAPPGGDTTGRSKKVEVHRKRFERHTEAFAWLLDLANYVRLRRRYRVALGWILFAVVLTAAGLIFYFYAATRPEPPGPDLRGAEITNARGLDLSGADLRGASLEDLHDADLTSANLTGAVLVGALDGAKLDSADLTNADLSGATGLDKVASDEGATWLLATCPDGREITSPNDSCP